MHQQPEEAMKLFARTPDPSERCLTLLFTSCARLGTSEALEYGEKIFKKLPNSKYKNEFLVTAALDMFVRCGDYINAEKLFAQIQRNVIDYGQMMKCFNENRMPSKTLNLYAKMKREGIDGNMSIYLLLIDACSKLRFQSKCHWIINELPLEILNNVKCQTALIDMWVRDVSWLIDRCWEINRRFSRVKPVLCLQLKKSFEMLAIETL